MYYVQGLNQSNSQFWKDQKELTPESALTLAKQYVELYPDDSALIIRRIEHSTTQVVFQEFIFLDKDGWYEEMDGDKFRQPESVVAKKLESSKTYKYNLWG